MGKHRNTDLPPFWWVVVGVTLILGALVLLLLLPSNDWGF